jgi:hypothetical protein
MHKQAEKKKLAKEKQIPFRKMEAEAKGLYEI